MNALVHSRAWLLLGWSMIHFLWVGAAVLVAAGALRLLLRRAAPNGRYVFAVATLVLLVAAPALVAIRLAPRSLADLETAPPEVARTMVDVPYQPGLATNNSARPISPQAVAAGPAEPALDLAAVESMLRRAGRIVAAYLPWLWLAGFPLTALYLLAGISGTGRLRRRARLATEPSLLAVLDRLAGELGIRGQIVMGLSAQVVAPLVVGIARPMILLPPVLLAGWSPEELELILLHELAHVRRWDNLVNLFQRIAEAVLFFHPAVWIVSRWVRLEREQCCDEIVLRHRDAPQKYAETLAALAVPGISPVHAAAAMANHQLVARIRNILNVEDRTMRFSARSLLVAVGSIALLVGLMFVAGPLAADEQTPANAVAPKAGGDKTQIDIGSDISVAGNGGENTRYSVRSLVTPNDALWIVKDGSQSTAANGQEKSNLPEEAIEAVISRDPQIQQMYAELGQLMRENSGIEKVIKKHSDPNYVAMQEQIASLKQSIEEAKSTARQQVRDQLLRSGEGSSAAKRPWGPEQACGAPDTLQPGDLPTAWASATPDGQREWLAVDFGEQIDAVALVVYENNAPGAVDKLVLLDAGGNAIETRGVGDPTPTTAPSGVSIFPLVGSMHGVRVEINSANVPGWNEIDAVGLLDKQGQVHWAKTAKASSTFADVAAGDTVQVGQQYALWAGDVVRFRPMTFTATVAVDDQFGNDPEIARLRKSIEEVDEGLRGTAIEGDAAQQELAKNRIRRAELRKGLLNEELEERRALLRRERAEAAEQQRARADMSARDTQVAAQRAAAAGEQARANAAKADADRAQAQAQLKAAMDANLKLRDELAVLQHRDSDERVRKAVAAHMDCATCHSNPHEAAARETLKEPVMLTAKQSLGIVAEKLGAELKELDRQAQSASNTGRAQIAERMQKLHTQLDGIQSTLQQLDKSLQDETARKSYRQELFLTRPATPARDDRAALERIEQLEKEVQELRRAQQSTPDSIFAPKKSY